MRHKKNKLLEISTWDKKKSIFTRQLLTNLIRSGKVVTTSKRAKILKSDADSFFARLIKIMKNNDKKGARRECIRYIKSKIYGEVEWKKVIDKLLPKYIENWNKSSFVSDYKVWFRKWDGAEKIMVKLN